MRVKISGAGVLVEGRFQGGRGGCGGREESRMVILGFGRGDMSGGWEQVEALDGLL